MCVHHVFAVVAAQHTRRRCYVGTIHRLSPYVPLNVYLDSLDDLISATVRTRSSFRSYRQNKCPIFNVLSYYWLTMALSMSLSSVTDLHTPMMTWIFRLKIRSIYWPIGSLSMGIFGGNNVITRHLKYMIWLGKAQGKGLSNMVLYCRRD